MRLRLELTNYISLVIKLKFARLLLDYKSVCSLATNKKYEIFI